MTSSIRKVDVVIVGAGFSGLATADRLVHAGYDVAVIEGRNRVGGRSAAGEIAGAPIDLGASFTGPGQDAVASLTKRFGCRTAPVYHAGRNVLRLGGRRQTYRGTIPKLSPMALVDISRIQLGIDRLARSVDLSAPWGSERVGHLDRMSFGDWLRAKHVRPRTFDLMRVLAKVEFGCVPDEVSMLHTLRLIKGVGGLDRLLDVEGGAQQDWFPGTFHQLATRFAESLGDRIVLDSPVRGISTREDGVVLKSERCTVSAEYAVVTVAPGHRGSIAFDPVLPDRHYGLSRTWRQGSLTKAFAAYPTPFWRADGLSGEAVSDSECVFITFDLSPDPQGPGILLAFTDPRSYDGYVQGERRTRVLGQLADLFGPQAQQPIDYVDHCWGNDPYAPGGPGPAVPPHAWSTFGPALREPVGKVHWAGADTADEWAGYVEGAIRSGWRAADEVTERIAHGE